MHAGATVVNRQQLPHGDVWLVANVNLRVHLIRTEDVLGAEARVEIVGLAGARVLLEIPHAVSRFFLARC